MFQNIEIPVIFEIFKFMSVFFLCAFVRVMLNCRFRVMLVFKLGSDFLLFIHVFLLGLISMSLL